MVSELRGGWRRPGPLTPARAAGYGLATCKGWSAAASPPARGGHPRTALPPARAATLAARVATPWQGDCRPQRAAVACVGAAATAAQ
ncbi:hypothetical protein GW17_00059897 [Ensete ventricosum]|nr:hypothetical protein GW17_00059897 [Ensete ventricosum]